MYNPSHTGGQPIEFARLSLAKFSHTTTSRSHRGPLHWRHIIGDGDIIGVFERLTISNHVLFKVLHRNYMIEQIDLTQLVNIAASESHVNSPGTSKSIFAVVVKLPCLAIKYPTGNTYISRFQIKFGQDRDYYTALSILSDIKCPFSESNIGQMPLTRRPSATQWQMGSSSVMASTVGGMPATGQYMPHGALDQSHRPTVTAPAATSSVTAAQTSLPSSSSGMHNVSADFRTNGTNQGSMRDMSLSQDMTQKPISFKPTNSNAPIRRPSTATTCYDAKSLENVLPPKRQLPFLKPAPQRVPTVPETSSMRSSMPLAEGPNRRQEANNRPTTSSGQIFRKPEQTINSRAINLQGTTTSPPEDPSILPKPTNIPISPANELSSIASSLQPNQKDQQPSNPTQNTTTENMPLTHEGTQSQTLDPNLANLSSYLSNPTAERTKDLENWICQNIEDDGFIQLCQDVESVWRRIAVGK